MSHAERFQRIRDDVAADINRILDRLRDADNRTADTWALLQSQMNELRIEESRAISGIEARLSVLQIALAAWDREPDPEEAAE